VRSAYGRYRALAYVTGTWLLFACLILVRKHLFHHPEGSRVAWTVHGWLYFVYFVSAVHLGLLRRWTVPKLGAVVLAGTIPFMSFVMERRISADEKPSPLR
jgi:integral membrane protein